MYAGSRNLERGNSSPVVAPICRQVCANGLMEQTLSNNVVETILSDIRLEGPQMQLEGNKETQPMQTLPDASRYVHIRNQTHTYTCTLDRHVHVRRCAHEPGNEHTRTHTDAHQPRLSQGPRPALSRSSSPFQAAASAARGRASLLRRERSQWAETRAVQRCLGFPRPIATGREPASSSDALSPIAPTFTKSTAHKDLQRSRGIGRMKRATRSWKRTRGRHSGS